MVPSSECVRAPNGDSSIQITRVMYNGKRLLVTGSSGLIGSEVCEFFGSDGWHVHGLDNNQRRSFFGEQGDTRGNQRRLRDSLSNFHHWELDIRDRDAILRLIQEIQPSAIVHAAAQPSHDLAAKLPLDDFDTNAVGTLNLLEATRRHCPESPFVHFSTNKVYGDAPNQLRLTELETRWDFADAEYQAGIPETFGIDQSLHSVFGASKVAADVMVQEYGRYFGMPTCCLRGGCLTGQNHSGVELHGFLSYLVKCNVLQKPYRVIGHGGKQVRDNLHSEDVARFVKLFIEAPRAGEVYNLGGGKANSCSVLEALAHTENQSGSEMQYEFDPESRRGDHVCYYSDLSKIRSHYPDWSVQISLTDIFEMLVNHWSSHRSMVDAPVTLNP